jgi:phage head maturation protease
VSVDQRGKLDGDVFGFRVTKDRKVFITWNGKHITTLSGNKADVFISNISGTEGKESQLIMAKATGNFKHGNEKMNKRLISYEQ